MFDYILFAVFPYIAFILAVVVGIYRYNTDRFSYSSFSSQFLENRQLFWGSVPWHYGILIILSAHLLAAFFPPYLGQFHRRPDTPLCAGSDRTGVGPAHYYRAGVAYLSALE